MPDLYQTILRPVITEKALAASGEGRYAFLVHPGANKLEIKKAIETLFENSGEGGGNVTVTSVNTINVKGKAKRYRTFGRFTQGTTAGYKKAYVTLAEGQAITLFEGV
ncbi:MAG: 50S ribosomal protein L23 [Armatimonas sp.]